nr:unnamed protein product [Digitaria exilis]
MIPPYLVEFLTTGSTCDTRSLVVTNPLPAACGAAGSPKNTLPALIDVHFAHALANPPTPALALYWHDGRTGPSRAPCPATRPGTGTVAQQPRLECSRQVVPVQAHAGLDVEVDAVEHGIAEGPGLGLAAEVVVPEVLGDVPRVGTGRQAVAADTPTDGEEHLDAHALARLDVRAHARAPVGGRVAVAGEVEHRRLALAERGEERYVDELVESGGACLFQRALVTVLAPVDGDVAGERSGG